MRSTRQTRVVGAFALAVWLAGTLPAAALPAFMKQFQQKYGWRDATCLVCHTTRAGGGTHNPYGLAFKNNGMNRKAFETIANLDSDGDGMPNLVEIRARAFPGDASSVPANAEPPDTSPKEGSSEKEVGEFDFDAESENGGANLGPISDLTLGGALDMRYALPGETLLPGKGGKSGTAFIHVAEFVVTANIGDNISILSEQLLLTGKTETTVADDHGFVYAIVRNLPVLPRSTSVKVGRFRHSFGVDAFSDAAANPLYTPVLRNLGFISDKGLQFAGFIGPVNYTFSTAVGPDTLRIGEAIPSTGGHGDAGHGGGGGTLAPIENNSKPVFLRVFGEIRPIRLRLGGSFFDGNSFRFNGDGVLDDARLVYKRRYALDGQLRFGRLTLSGEYSRGFDRPLQDYLTGVGALAREAPTEGFYARADLPLTAATDLSVKFDAYNPNTDFYKLAETDVKAPLTTLGGAFTWHPQEAVAVRIVYQANNLTREQPTGTLTTQFLVEY